MGKYTLTFEFEILNEFIDPLTDSLVLICNRYAYLHSFLVNCPIKKVKPESENIRGLIVMDARFCSVPYETYRSTQPSRRVAEQSVYIF
jgi:hypothetical protein